MLMKLNNDSYGGQSLILKKIEKHGEIRRLHILFHLFDVEGFCTIV